MPTLYITEYTRLAGDNLQNAVPAGEGPGIMRAVPIGPGGAQSQSFASSTRFVRVMADEPCKLAFGDDPTADTGCMLLPADEPEFFGVTAAGMRVAVITQ